MTARIKATVGIAMCVGLGLITWVGMLPGKADAG
jgi:hypothetical protein